MNYYDLINFALVSASEGGDGFDWIYVLKHALNLAILLGIIVYYTKNPFLNFLKNRKEKITKEINEARDAIEEAKLKHEEYKGKLANLADEINSLKENISKQAEIEKQELIKHANHSSELIKKEVTETISLETLKAKEDIQNEVINSSITIAERLIKENLENGYTSDSVDDFIQMIEEGKWQQLQH